ncbi:MAG TPA: 3-oxoacyl-[acyl-carrier-protein] synthase III C-terminal domain-containing protein [Kofleriaceae bacterium]|nr:3-oxoacyl-[acyl-carrier-protein] synthase III C-terminal domain-containing protein [Kofleriaceae bacterium]
MADIYVHDFALSLGDHDFSLEESVAAGRTHTGAHALAEAGFRRHRVAREGQSAYDLARAAVTPIAGAAADAGAIIYATCLPLNGNIGDVEQFRATRDVKHLMDFPVSHLQADFGLDRAAAIGLGQQACTSMLGSLRIARALLRDEPELGRILCVSADRFPAGAEHEQAYNLISDGAAACVVSTVPRGYKIVACHQLTNGALARASDDETVGTYFSYTARLLRELMAKAGLGPGQIDWVVPQNTHVKAWTILGRLLGLPEERIFFRTIGEIGHVISADNVANLMRLERDVALAPGARLLLPMAGFGLNWQAVILEKV